MTAPAALRSAAPQVKPAYAGKCFANLPATIQYWLTGGGAPALSSEALPPAFAQAYDLVVLLFVDSLGWQFIERYVERAPFLKRMAREGALNKITSQFPSTTAAHVTCIHTGVPVGQSGVYEWQYYEPKLDALITPLLFSFAGTMERDTLKATGIDPTELYPTESVYQKLAARGVTSYSFGSRDYTPSTYSSTVMRGAKISPYKTFPEALTNLGLQAGGIRTPGYLFFYFGDVDGMCHGYGPDSPQTDAEIQAILYGFENFLLPALRASGKRCIVALTADHGHMAVTPEETRYLNLEHELREILPHLRRDASGAPLVPAGSPRDPFLYVLPEAVDETADYLARELDGYADVYKTDDLVQAGYFGALPISAELEGRLGNVVILPHPHKCVWWYERDRFEQKFRGHHGGLSPTEMEIPLGLLDVSP